MSKQYFLLEIEVGEHGHIMLQDVLEVVDDVLVSEAGGWSSITDGYELPEDVAKAVMASVDNRFQEVS